MNSKTKGRATTITEDGEVLIRRQELQALKHILAGQVSNIEQLQIEDADFMFELTKFKGVYIPAAHIESITYSTLLCPSLCLARRLHMPFNFLLIDT
jgi:hypothetical protein